MLMDVPIVFGFLPDINVFVVGFPTGCLVYYFLSLPVHDVALCGQ